MFQALFQSTEMREPLHSHIPWMNYSKDQHTAKGVANLTSTETRQGTVNNFIPYCLTKKNLVTHIIGSDLGISV